MRRFIGLLLLMILFFSNISILVGCESMGHATGEAAEEVEEGAEDFEKGYEDAKD